MELVFRILYLLILVSALVISGTYRKRARATGDVIPRKAEGPIVLMLRLFFGLPLLAALLLYAIYPRAMAWSQLQLPLWLRIVGAGVAVTLLPFLVWVFRSIGRNISETVLTKTDHSLVTSGPYRWIRHPLYTGSIMLLLSLSLMASNWMLLLLALIALIIFRIAVIPVEEQKLTQAFGAAYREYQEQSGTMFPKLF